MLQVRAVLQAPAVAGPRVTISRSVLAGRVIKKVAGRSSRRLDIVWASLCLPSRLVIEKTP